VLGQSAFDPNDAFSPPSKTFALASAALRVFDAAAEALTRGVAFADIPFDDVRRALAHVRDAPAVETERAHRRINEAVGAIASATANRKTEEHA